MTPSRTQETSIHRPRPLALPVVAFMTLCLAALPAFGAVQNFPLPIKVESVYDRTNVYLAIESDSPGQPLSQVAAGAGAGTPEAFLAQVVATLAAGDLAAFAALVNPGDGSDLPQILARYNSALAVTPDPVVVDVYRLGNLHYFVLDVAHPDVPIAPIPVLEVGAGHAHAFGLLTEPVVQNVSALARLRHLEPSLYAAVASPSYITEITLPPLFGSSGANPVRLRFSGVPIPASTATAPDKRLAGQAGEALDFYLDYRRAYARRDTEALLEDLGPLGREKLERYLALAASGDPRGEHTRQWLRTRPPAAVAEKMAPDIDPIYVIVAKNNLYLFFGDASREAIYYEYVRSGSTGFEVVNFQRHNPLDLLLLWPPVAEDLQDELPPPPAP